MNEHTTLSSRYSHPRDEILYKVRKQWPTGAIIEPAARIRVQQAIRLF